MPDAGAISAVYRLLLSNSPLDLSREGRYSVQPIERYLRRTARCGRESPSHPSNALLGFVTKQPFHRPPDDPLTRRCAPPSPPRSPLLEVGGWGGGKKPDLTKSCPPPIRGPPRPSATALGGGAERGFVVRVRLTRPSATLSPKDPQRGRGVGSEGRNGDRQHPLTRRFAPPQGRGRGKGRFSETRGWRTRSHHGGVSSTERSVARRRTQNWGRASYR